MIKGKLFLASSLLIGLLSNLAVFVQSKDVFTVKLENFNGWNLPFAFRMPVKT